MKPSVARFVSRLIANRVSPLLLNDVIGDLSEDFAVMCRERGRVRATWWLLTAIVSLRRSQAPMTRMMRFSDVRVAMRTLRSRLAYAAVALLTITLVVGAGSAILAVISASFLRPLPFAHEHSLMWLYSRPPGGTVRRNPMHSPTYLKMHDELRLLTDIAGVWSRERAADLTGTAETIDGAGVSANLFHTLGIQPAAGRMFTDAEDHADAKVALVSDAFWRGRLGAARVLGTTLKIDNEPYVVIGILPPMAHNDFVDADVFTPLAISAGNLPSPNATLVRMFGRIPDGATAAQLQGAIDTAMADAVKDRADVMNGWTASFIPVREGLFGDTRPALTLLAVAILVLGAIASANLANITIAEIASRRGELSLRAALGGSRGDLMRLMLTEHFLLAVTGGVAGLLAARLLLPLILSLDPSVAASLGDIAIDWRVQLGALVLAMAVGVLSGVIPTFLSTRGDLAHALAQSGRRTSGSRRQANVRAWLVASETALAAVLLASSALLLGAFWNTVNVSPGFDPTNVLGAQVRLPAAAYPGVGERAIFVRRVLDEIRSQPGVIDASATFNTFQGGGFNISLSIDGHPTADGRPRTMQFRRVAPGYFSLMKIREMKGRTFTDADDMNAPLTAVVSQSFVSAFLAGEDPIGKRLIRSSDVAHPVTVVGVVADVRDGGLSIDPGPTVYLPYGQNSVSAAPISLVVRTSGDPRTMERSVADALHRVDATIPLTRPTTMAAFLRESLGPARFRSVLLALLSALGLILSIVGIFGVTSRGVTERTRELGVRLALGSGRAELWGNVVRRAFAAVAIGFAAAVPLAWFASRSLAQWMPGVSDVSVWTVLPAWGMLSLGGLAAAALPALRAARLDPIIALRAE